MIETFLAASYIHVCGRRDPNINQCILDNVNNMKDKLCMGIPELSVPAFEPVIIDKLVVADTPNTKFYLKNVVINGLCDFDVKSLQSDLKKNHFKVDLILNHIIINATYDIDARIVIPINQKGDAFVKTDDVRAIANMDLTITSKNGKRYVYMSQMKINLDLKTYDIQLNVDERERSELSRIVGIFIGSNQKDIIAVVKPLLEEVISKRILLIANEIVKHFTYEELFPDRT
ncbi:hypothetical protein X777_16539 [Ooceraea biroi]|uniref:Circadian clock-controlled protein n=1 Tax=Ooceraea biroi TaxID=2015173 RepID=A0A026VU05_OOCBI|nr:hypothetical protein X777_16539 [Ooceraea biroi]